MAGILIPGTPTTVFWPARSKGLIRIRSVIPLDRRRHIEVPVELRFKREHLSPALNLSAKACPARNILERQPQKFLSNTIRRWFGKLRSSLPVTLHPILAHDPEVYLTDWASAIAVTLLYYGRAHSQENFVGMPSREESRFRWRNQVLKSSIPGIPYTLKVDRILLRDLPTSVTGQNTWLFLVSVIRRNVLQPVLIDWALNGRPRGKHAMSPLILPYARMALYMADRLVDEAERDSELSLQLMVVLQQDRYCRRHVARFGSVAEYLESTGTRGRHRLAVLLVDRTLRSVWEKFHLTAPRRCDPEYVFKNWLRPEHREHCEAEARRLKEGHLAKLWYRRLLGPENQTANDFDLLA